MVKLLPFLFIVVGLGQRCWNIHIHHPHWLFVPSDFSCDMPLYLVSVLIEHYILHYHFYVTVSILLLIMLFIYLFGVSIESLKCHPELCSRNLPVTAVYFLFYLFAPYLLDSVTVNFSFIFPWSLLP